MTDEDSKKLDALVAQAAKNYSMLLEIRDLLLGTPERDEIMDAIGVEGNQDA